MKTSSAGNHQSPLEVGGFEIVVIEGGVGAVLWQGTEVLRGANCLVRDANWGTHSVEKFSESRTRLANGQVNILQNYKLNNGALSVELGLSIDPGGVLELTANITALKATMTNRAGLVVLHPIAHVAGADLKITHPDGSELQTKFPELISPGQPAKDISTLTHTISGIDVTIAFSGEVFEMEDQRNWSDASFKTYCRPLALPFPYDLKTGEAITQSLKLTVKSASDAAQIPAIGGAQVAIMPELLFALEHDWLPEKSDWPTIKSTGIKGLLLRVHSSEFETQIWTSAAAFAENLGATIDLELVLSGGDYAAQIQVAAMRCQAANLNPVHVIALPEIWLKSWQPGQGPSPNSLTASIEATKVAFPNAKTGAGMLTNFTELNRYPVDGGDYVTHANTAIVHAADDLSVWQTLETLPHIFASGKVIAKGRKTRLGLMCIGMRTNPYGDAVAENPDGMNKAMAGNDPRQQEVFAAAYAIGVAIKASFGGVEALALAAPVGRFGVMSSDKIHPLFHCMRAMARMSGQKVKLHFAGGLIGIEAEEGDIIIANCSIASVVYHTAMPLRGRILDAHEPKADWLDSSPTFIAKSFCLASGQCLFASRDFSQ